MVSTDVQIALFGGVGSSSAVFGETWTFDGKHWTHRQDIGPVPRSSHAMSFDAARRTIVLFGGPDVTEASLHDTWEHTETDPPTPPNGGGTAVNVSSITVPPMQVGSGQQVTA